MAILDNQAIRNVHCTGIGGIGVSGVAELLLRKGYQVSGSDVSKSATTTRLQSLGATITKGHASSNVQHADLVVYSSAISQDNPEMIAAKTAQIPLISRGQLLAELMSESEGIAISGTHGKTTTTGLLAQIFVSADMDPSYLIGGKINDQSSTVRMGEGQFFIAEADESDASFLYMSPKIVVVANLEPDHMETYHDNFSELKQSFLDFIEKLPEDGVAILGVDNPAVRALIPQISKRVVTFGFSEDADIRASDFKQVGLESYFSVSRGSDDASLLVQLNLPGQHNVLNALAAISVAKEVGIDDFSLLNTLRTFPGVGRRFHAHGKIAVKGGAVLLFEDYGHHPSAIDATVKVARQAWPDRRIVLAFQPHRYSRTRDLFQAFVKSLSAPDVLLLLDVYAAGEQPIVGADGSALCEAISQQGQIEPVFISKIDTLSKILKDVLLPDDVLILQGAGNVGAIAATLLEVS